MTSFSLYIIEELALFDKEEPAPLFLDNAEEVCILPKKARFLCFHPFMN